VIFSEVSVILKDILTRIRIMKKIILDVPENKFKFLMELLTNLGIKPTIDNPKTLTLEQKQFIKELQLSLKEVDKHLKGEIKLKSAKAFLNDL